jgi:glyoxylate reductase
VARPVLACGWRPAGAAFEQVERLLDVRILDAPVRPWLLAGNAADAIWTSGERIDGELLDRAQGLRAVVNHGVGTDTIDRGELRRRGVALVVPAGANAQSVAEHAFALLLAVRHRILEGDRAIRAGEFRAYNDLLPLGEDVTGTTLGIVGRGAIGREMERMAEGFGMRTLVHSRSAGVPLDRLLAESDAVTLHCPLNDATRGLIGRDRLALMRPGAVLINTARGAVCDQEALADALESGALLGAGLDVFAGEPEVPARLLAHPRVVVTPHVADATVDAQEALTRACADGLLSALGVDPPAAR